MNSIDIILNKLSKSKFRASFKLKEEDFVYIEKVGINKIANHAYDFINHRLKPKYIKNDGRQTPMKGHPVFVAEHATATCCRGCLFKWHHIKKDKELTELEVRYIVNVIMKWINNQIELENK